MRAYELEESAVEELKDRLPKLKSHSYDTIDRLMQHVSSKHKITGKKLHDMFVQKYGHTPDTWIKKIKSRVSGQGLLKELAPGIGDNGDNGMGYIHALAKAWYTQDLSLLADIARKGGSPMKKIIDAQVAVEKILDRGVHCPDGKIRKYYINYNSEFDGVDMVSHDYYEHSDYGPNDEYVDGRTGKPWSAYDHIEFSDDQLNEGEVLPLKRPMNKVQHGKRTFPPTQRDVKEPEGNVTPLKKSKMNEGVEGPKDVQKIKDFIKWSYKTLNMQKPYPKITISKNTEVAQAGHHTGVHKGNNIWVYVGNRNLIDIFRTIFHELTHHRQMQLNMIKDGDSYPGSPIEMLADMAAGKYIKVYGKDHPEMFQ